MQPPTPRVLFATLAAVIVIALAVPVAQSASEPDRSTANFCKTYNAEKAEYLKKYNRLSDGSKPLADLMNSIEAMSAWAPLFDRLDKVAPPEIEPDVATIRDSLKQAQQAAIDHAGDPIASIGSSLFSGLMAMSSWEKVGQFVEDNCVTAEEKAQREQAAQAAIDETRKQEEITTIKNNLTSAVSNLDYEVSQRTGADLTYDNVISGQAERMALLKSAFADLKRSVAETHADSYDCAYPQYATWTSNRDQVLFLAEEFKGDAESLNTQLSSASDLRTAANAVTDAKNAYDALVPGSAESAEAATKVTPSLQLADQIDAANKKATKKVADTIAEAQAYVPKAKAVAAKACK